MSKEERRREPEITAAIISVVGTLVGTLLIGVLLGFMEGRIGLGPVVAVITLLLVLSIWVLLAFRWGIRLAGAAAAAMVIVGSVLFLIVTATRIIPFGVPSATPVAAAASPTPATLPPAPTPLPSEEVHAFVRSILATIADRPPDFRDDFSDPGSGWDVGGQRSDPGGQEGKRAYVDGEYFIEAPPGACTSGGTPRMPELSDFVLKVDGRFVTGDEGDWQVHFRPRKSPDRFYAAFLGLNGGARIAIFHEDEGERPLVEFQGPPLQAGFQTNQLQIIAKGPEIAASVNGEPLALVRDESSSEGRITLLVCNYGDTPLEVRFDNFELWDISDLSK